MGMSLAALSGDGIYNFGEVLATPISTILHGSEKQWLDDTLKAFNNGDVEKFNLILETNRDAFLGEPTLQIRQEFVKEKLAILSFMNLVLETPAHDRNISFGAIASRTRLSIDQIEWLVMRCI